MNNRFTPSQAQNAAPNWALGLQDASMSQSKSQHILDLAKELLDDIELSRIGAESLLLKASRLARWVGSDEVKYWLQLEMAGYNSSNPTSVKYMGLTAPIGFFARRWHTCVHGCRPRITVRFECRSTDRYAVNVCWPDAYALPPTRSERQLPAKLKVSLGHSSGFLLKPANFRFWPDAAVRFEYQSQR
jgi:hypothetical protein